MTKPKRKRSPRKAVKAAVHLPIPVDLVEVRFPEPVPTGAKVQIKGKSIFIQIRDFLIGAS